MKTPEQLKGGYSQYCIQKEFKTAGSFADVPVRENPGAFGPVSL